MFTFLIKRKPNYAMSPRFLSKTLHYLKEHSVNQKIAFISSANSLGFMDGGSDLGYMKSIPDIQKHVQDGFKVLGDKTLLKRNYMCIGNTMGFKLPWIGYHSEFYFVSAPTMFLPQKVPNTGNPYFALRSALKTCKAMGITQVYCPMMCTNWGGYTMEESFEMMSNAVQDYSNYTSSLQTSGGYLFNLLDDNEKKRITELQPKLYCNTEFYVELDLSPILD